MRTERDMMRSMLTEICTVLHDEGAMTEACVMRNKKKTQITVLFVGDDLADIPWTRRQALIWKTAAKYPVIFRKLVRLEALTHREFDGTDAVDRGASN